MGQHAYISAKGERLSKNLCVFTFEVFPSPTMLEVLRFRAPKCQSSSKKPFFLPLLTPSKNLHSISMFYSTNIEKKEAVLQIRDLCAGLPSPREMLLSLVSSQVLAYKFLFWLLETCSQQDHVCAQTSQRVIRNEIGLKKNSQRERLTVLLHF